LLTQGLFDQALFYELGRTFWFYHDQMAQIDGFVTGFAIANRYISMDRAGLPGGPFGNLSYADFEKSDTVDLLTNYLEGPNYNWQNTLLEGGKVLGWGAADIAGSMFYRIYTDNGFDVYSKFWQTVGTLPQAPTPNAAIVNFISAAASASGRDYSFLLKAPLQDQPGCTFSLDSSNASFPNAGGTGSVAVTAAASCSWIVSDFPDWVTVTGGAAGTGNGTLNYAVSTGTNSPRIASFMIAGIPFTIFQAEPAGCTYSLSASGASLPSQAGTGAIGLTTTPSCSWTVSGAPDWVTIISGPSGTGASTISYFFAQYQGASPRSATLTIAGIPYSLEQEDGLVSGLPLAGSMPQIASAGGWETTLTLVNTTASSQEALLNFFGDDGSAGWFPFTFPQQLSQSTILGSTFDQTLNANAILVLDTNGPVDERADAGWAQLSANQGVSGFAVFKYTPTGQEALVPLETRNAPSYVLAFDNTGIIANGLAIANASPNAASIPAIVRDDSGSQIATGSLNLPAEGHASFMLTDSASGFPVAAGRRGTVEFDTPQGGQISVLGLRANGTALTTLPVLANVGTTGGTMAHIASGGGWQTTFTLVNTGTTQANAILQFFGDDGNGLLLPLYFPQFQTTPTWAAFDYTFSPGATLVFQTQGLSSQPCQVGSALLTTSGQITGFAIFQDTLSGQEAVVPLESRNSNSYVLAFDNTSDLATGVALTNITSTAVSVGVIIRDDTGTQIGSDTIPLTPNEHISFMLTDDYAFTAGKRGTVEFDTPSGGQIAVLGLRATPAGAFTTIPVLAK
jgi:hypothetical protein